MKQRSVTVCNVGPKTITVSHGGLKTVTVTVQNQNFYCKKVLEQKISNILFLAIFERLALNARLRHSMDQAMNGLQRLFGRPAETIWVSEHTVIDTLGPTAQISDRT